jgi:pSer/pThr/pTyr-binding forkhead associated (FHA) protein
MQQGKQQPQHQLADGPIFWNITHDFAPGELESDLSKMFFNQALDLHKENESLKQRIHRLESALREISNQDYRGNRSTESEIAFRALQP